MSARGKAQARAERLGGIEASRGHAVSCDGTRIAFTVTEARKADAPWIVLANGPWPMPPLGLVDYLGDRYRFAWWDPRGTGGSSVPATSSRGAYAVERHVEDLDAVAHASGIVEAAVVGLGTGSQVALEAYRRRPQTQRALVLVAGTFGRERIEPPAALLRAGLRSLAARLAARHPREANRLARRVAASRSGVFLARALGLVGADLDDGGAAELVGALADSDLEPILATLRAAKDHDAARILADVTAPTLVVTGDRDEVASPGLSVRMQRRLPRAEVLTVRGGTHFVALEYPEHVALRVERFLRERGYPS